MVLGLACTVAAFAIGMNVPLVTSKATWTYLVFAYIFLAAVLPMWLLMQPRDFMTTFMFAGMILGAVVGLVVAHPKMNLPMYTGFHNAASGDLFPILFVTVACGAVSGFHSLVSSGTSSKTIANEKDMQKVGYGAMVLESLLAVLAPLRCRCCCFCRRYGCCRNAICDLFFRCCRISGNVRHPGIRSTVLHDDVCIGAGTYQS